jgi:hypothetical protein
MATIPERVEAGARALDRAIVGWADHIDLAGLDLAVEFYPDLRDGCGCVLAQLDLRALPVAGRDQGSYGHGMVRLLDRHPALEEEWAIAHGFTASLHDPADAFEQLTQAWRQEITARRQQLVAVT